MAIADLAGNPLSLPAAEQMLGFTEPTPAAEVLPLDMYDFLIEPIRVEDRKTGNLLVKRLLQGPQTVWLENTARIFALKDLWSVTDCPDEFLIYLKNILGWTSDPVVRRITDALSADELRRLIAVSAPLWKRRGTESSIVQFLSFLTAQRVRIWNWFDFRWILGETEITWDGLRRDSWLVAGSEDPGAGPQRFNVRIVDPGTLDHGLIRNVVRLMRAVGERVDISYVRFMDTFDQEGDDSQWTQPAGTSMTVAGGKMTLSDDSVAERAVVAVEGSEEWAELVMFSHISAELTTPGAKVGLVFYYTDESNYYSATLDIDADRLKVDKVVSGAPSNIADVDLAPIFGDLQESIPYMLRVEVVRDGSDNLIRVYLDGTSVVETGDTSLGEGTIGLIHDSGATLEAGEVEMFLLPMTMDTVEINT